MNEEEAKRFDKILEFMHLYPAMSLGEAMEIIEAEEKENDERK